MDEGKRPQTSRDFDRGGIFNEWTAKLLQLWRQNAKIFVRLVRVHAVVNNHRFKRERADSSDCRFYEREDETTR